MKKCTLIQDVPTDQDTVCNCVTFGLYLRSWNGLNLAFNELHVPNGKPIPPLGLGRVVVRAGWKQDADCQCVKRAYDRSKSSKIRLQHEVDKGDGLKTRTPRMGEDDMPMLGRGDLRQSVGGIHSIAPSEYFTGSDRGTRRVKFTLKVGTKECKVTEHAVEKDAPVPEAPPFWKNIF